MWLYYYLNDDYPENIELDKDMPQRLEYRLICIGTLYDRTVKTFNWRNTDSTKMVMYRPIEVGVTNMPIDSYPQELCARLKIYPVQRKSERVFTGLPIGRYVMEELSSILTVLTRRCIQLEQKIHAKQLEGGEEEEKVTLFSDLPTPLKNLPYYDLIFDEPPNPVGVDPGKIENCMRELGSISKEEYGTFISAAKRYKTSLLQMKNDPDIAYQLLISCIETLANFELSDFDPSIDKKIDSTANLYEKSQEYGASEEDAKELVRECTKSTLHWSTKKFVKFIIDNLNDTLWEQDDLFDQCEAFIPEPGKLEKTLKKIYNRRSKHLHGGESFPSYVGFGLGDVSAKMLHDMVESEDMIPPVTWFERVVSLVVNSYLTEKTGISEITGKEWFLNNDEIF